VLTSPRFTAAILVTGLAAGTATGCGQSETGAGGPPRVAYLATSLTKSYSVAIAAGYRSGVAEVPGVLQEVVAPPGDADPIAQRTMFQGLLKTAASGIAFSSSAPEEFVDVLSEAHESGIPLIAVDIPPPAESGVALYVGNDNQNLGQMLADLVIDRLPPGASGAVVLGNPRPGLPVLDLRAVAVREQFAKRLPKVRVQGPYDTTVRSASAGKAWSQLSSANPKALAMLSVGADGPVMAKLRHDTKATWQAAAFDLDPDSLAAAKRGDLLLVSPEHFIKGAIAGRLIADAAAGEKPLPEGWINTAGLGVTTANADSIIAREASDAARAAWFKPLVADAFGNGGPKLRPLTEVR